MDGMFYLVTVQEAQIHPEVAEKGRLHLVTAQAAQHTSRSCSGGMALLSHCEGGTPYKNAKMVWQKGYTWKIG